MNRFSPLSNNKLKDLGKLRQKKYRDRWGLYFGEGLRLLNAAFDAGSAELIDIVLSTAVWDTDSGKDIRSRAQTKGITVYRITEPLMNKLSDEVSPSGIFFTVKKNPVTRDYLQEIRDPIIVFLMQISDPGNLGTILRSMSWFGIGSLLLSPDCVDAYNPKTVRASAGGIFNIRILENIPPVQALNMLKARGYLVAATQPAGGTIPRQIDLKQPVLLLFGSEAAGLPDSVLSISDLQITIPRKGAMESLNLAVSAAILFYHFAG